MQNNFSQDAFIIFQEAWCCWLCGMNTSDCLHHIVGRGEKGSKVESSILNAAPLCNQKCHLANHGKLRTDKYVVELLKKTFDYLHSKGYTLNENDINFIRKYWKYYKQFVNL